MLSAPVNARVLISFLVVCSSGCTCGVLTSETRFACQQDSDCGPDFTCASGECLAACPATPCPTGRTCEAARCVDVDECTTRAGVCGDNTECTNTPGSYQCACITGFMGASTTGSAATCTDVDECDNGFNCGVGAVCNNLPGSFECACPSGTFGATVRGAATSCSSTDHCTTPGQCGPNAACTTTADSFTCTCETGYQGATTTGASASCTDVNECIERQGACGANTVCTNSTGSFSCVCASGYRGTATTGTAASCTDVDECANSALNCGGNAHCVNTDGNYQCACNTGAMGTTVTGGPATCTVGGSCTGVSCGANATCSVPPLGTGYVCTCNSGFVGETKQNGPTTCTATATCANMNCGAHATCSVLSGTAYQCACDPGWQGSTTQNSPTSCTDVNECANPSVMTCSVGQTCSNTQGSFTCACPSGTTGATTTGMPATCTPVVSVITTLGSGLAPVTLTAGAPAGTKLIALLGTENGGSTGFTDPRGNTWTRLVGGNYCAACGSVGLWQTTLTTAMQPGDVITTTNSTSLLWIANPGPYTALDVNGSNATGQTTAPSVQTNTAVTNADELQVGMFSTRNQVAVSLDGGWTTTATSTGNLLSSVMGFRQVMGGSGVQTLSGSSATSQRFGTLIATFYAGVQANPTQLSLTHTANERTFAVSWVGGRANGGAGGCALQVQTLNGWSTVANVNCDATTSMSAATLGADGWYGGPWSTVAVRLLRQSDSAVVGTFVDTLHCASKGSSATSTPSTDENCDNQWDDRTCSSFQWTSGPTYPAGFTACTNSSGYSISPVQCNSGNDGLVRYVEAQYGPVSPSIAPSSDQYGTACMGSGSGAVTWTCGGTNCSYF